VFVTTLWNINMRAAIVTKMDYPADFT